MHSAAVVLNILARRREPARLITVTTPDALRPQHEPEADCARYDSFRESHGGTPANLATMGELKLYGMKAVFDEFNKTPLMRSYEPK